MTSQPAQSQFDVQKAPVTTVFTVILAISFCHMLNDMMQSLLPAIYPELKARFGLTFDSYGGPRSQAEVEAVVRKDGRAGTHICYWVDGPTP